MAKFNPPKSRTVIEKSVFANPKSRHEQHVRDHHFNYAVDLFLPGCTKLPSDLREVCPDQDTYWLVKDLPLLELAQVDFIQKFLKRGDFYALSSGTRIDTDNVIALLPTGELIVSVTKDTYEELGLEGKPSRYDQRRKPTRYIVEVDVTSDSFKKGKRGYERVQWCFKDRLDLTFDFFVAWKPAKDNHVELESYWSKYICRKVPVKKETIRNSKVSLEVPVIDSCHLTSSKTKGRGQGEDTSSQTGEERGQVGSIDDLNERLSCDATEVFEWLGAISCGMSCDGEPDGFLSTYACPKPSHQVSSAICHRWTGFITPNRIAEILKALRHHVTSNPAGHWAAVTVHGYADSPVSWGKREHGYNTCGDNLYTFVVFPEDHGRYWYIAAVGAHDDLS